MKTICEQSGKIAYTSNSEAKKFMRTIGHTSNRHTYRCGYCGMIHVTSRQGKLLRNSRNWTKEKTT